MANGFHTGYFGMQVNSENERRVLFSVWSPFKTDNPKQIPKEQRVRLIDKGDNVISNDFGGEGSGGQSRKRFMWEAGKTYGFLLKGEPSPDEPNHSDYTAWFRPPGEGWQLIASWRRPKESSYLKGWYSFAENFREDTGDQERKCLYGR